VWWQVNVLNGLLDEVMEKYHVDKDRVYLTGLSMGGFGTWAWAAHDPQRFAAIAPIVGGAILNRPTNSRAFRSGASTARSIKSVPIQKSEEMIEAVKQAGNKEVEFTRYPDAGHDCWTRSYANPDLYEWS